MEGHDIVVVGASAGGVEALGQLVQGLPNDLPAAVLIVLHISPDAPSALPAILNRRGPLLARHAVHDEEIGHSRVYVAPPDRHLLVSDTGRISLALGPRENGHRPAVDPLFRTAAAAYGPRVVGVVLSGALDDGTAGLAAIKRRGGVALVQDPADALTSGMPRSAVDSVDVDEVGDVSAICTSITRLAKEPAASPFEPVTDELAVETGIGELNMDALHQHDRPGTPSGFSCPDCGGVLWELQDDGRLVRFRCRVGHAWSGGSLLSQQVEALEASLWVALRNLEERAALAHKLFALAQEQEHPRSAERFGQQERDAQEAAERIRDFLVARSVHPPSTPAARSQRHPADSGRGGSAGGDVGPQAGWG